MFVELKRAVGFVDVWTLMYTLHSHISVMMTVIVLVKVNILFKPNDKFEPFPTFYSLWNEMA